MIFIQTVVNIIIQLLVFTLIPFIWWFIRARKQSSFFEWVGLKKPEILDRNKFILVVVLDMIIFFVQMFWIIPLFIDNADLASAQFSGLGFAALIPALSYSFIETGLAEEIFFRGFLGKRFIQAIGFTWGNFLQAILFGAVHGLLFLNSTSLIGALIITFITGLTGWLMGLMNEKYSNGSIVPSLLVHGFTNFIVSLITMFGLL